MASSTYSINFGGTVTAHGLPALAVSAWVNDGDEDDGREYTQADALAASGDFFVAMASRLDLLSQSMPQDSAEQIELEHIIDTLFYLQRHYRLIAKSKLKY